MTKKLPCGCSKGRLQAFFLRLSLKRKWFDLFDLLHGQITLTSKGLI